MTYGEMKRLENAAFFNTEEGKIDCKHIRCIENNRIKFNVCDSMSLKRVDIDSLVSSLQAVIQKYTNILDDVKKYKEGSNENS